MEMKNFSVDDPGAEAAAGAETEKKPELTIEKAEDVFGEAFDAIAGAGLNDAEQKMLAMMRIDVKTIAVNALNADNSYERFRSEEWAMEAGVEKDVAWQFAARVYREAAKKAEEAGFDGGPLTGSAEFFEGTRYVDGGKMAQEKQQ